MLVLGSLNLDLVVHAPRLPWPGETLMGRHFDTDEGGKGANQAVAAALAGHAVTHLEQALAAGSALLRRGPKQVVVTLGALGLVLATPEGTVHQTAPKVQAVDSTGAGDTFVGTLAAGLAQGLPPLQALRWGQAAAALAVTRRGTQSAMPTRDEVFARFGDAGTSTGWPA